ncbi:hypothetical protein UP06_27955 [Bradyrhizobium sp. LTSP857]|nr:hypothetical protein UP06_27955 [Bradyrhizobium sp. LTSP857]
MVLTRYLKCAFVLALLPSKIMALPIFESGICTHVDGLDQAQQVKKPTAAGPNAIQDARNAYIERFGKPTFENRYRPDSVTLTWVTKDGPVPVAQDVIIEIVRGDLHIRCGLTF